MLTTPTPDLSRVMVPVDVPGTERTEKMLGEFIAIAASGSVAYCKDWHIDRCATLKGLYTVPACFRDDWLNWYWQEVVPNVDPTAPEDDYSFCYIGTKGSSTGFHHDVVYSYSWSVSLQGVKRWKLWPNEGQREDPYVEVLQQPGDAIFVPSGCYHEVENIAAQTGTGTGTGESELVVSINRNWFNGFCIRKVFAFLKREHDSVQRELMDVFKPPPTSASASASSATVLMPPEEWYSHCDVILRANAAMNWQMFLCLVTARVLLMETFLYDNNQSNLNLKGPSLFCEKYTPVLTEEQRDIMTLQRATAIPDIRSATCDDSGDDSRAATVWEYTRGELLAVLKSIRKDSELLEALTFIYDRPQHHVDEALGELCSCLII